MSPTPTPAPHAPSSPKLRRRHRRALCRLPGHQGWVWARKQGVSARVVADLAAADLARPGVRIHRWLALVPRRTVKGSSIVDMLCDRSKTGWADLRSVNALRRLVRP